MFANFFGHFATPGNSDFTSKPGKSFYKGKVNLLIVQLSMSCLFGCLKKMTAVSKIDKKKLAHTILVRKKNFWLGHLPIHIDFPK